MVDQAGNLDQANREVEKRLKLFILLNPIAGHSSAPEIRKELEDRFADQEYEIYETTGQEDIAEITRAACQRGAQIVIAAGGDGTVAGAVNGLRGTQTPLGIIPVGTGNGLARALGIPLEIPNAIELIAGTHELLSIDLMQVGDKYFTLDVSAGISARAMRETPPEEKRRFGVAAYVWRILTLVFGIQPRRFLLSIDGHSFRVHASEILVSNGAFLRDPFPLGPPELFGDGQFDVYIITARTLRDYINILWGLLFKNVERTELRHYASRKLTVIQHTGRPQPTQADGEFLGHTPVEIELVPHGLSVIVPPKSSEKTA